MRTRDTLVPTEHAQSFIGGTWKLTALNKVQYILPNWGWSPTLVSLMAEFLPIYASSVGPVVQLVVLARSLCTNGSWILWTNTKWTIREDNSWVNYSITALIVHFPYSPSSNSPTRYVSMTHLYNLWLIAYKVTFNTPGHDGLEALRK